MRYYHGTNYTAGMQILQTKTFGKSSDTIWDCPDDTVWNCSDPTKTYIVGIDFDECSIDEKFTNSGAFWFTREAAQIAAATQNDISESIIIFEFEIPDDDDSIEKDWSTGEQNECYAINNQILNAKIAEGTIQLKAYEVEKAYIPYMRPFYLATLINNPYYVFREHILQEACEFINAHEYTSIFEDLISRWHNIKEITINP